jgi:acyl dehydratase
MSGPSQQIRPLSDVFDCIGQQLGPSDWTTLTREQMEHFAAATYLSDLPGYDGTISGNNELGADLVDGFLVNSLLIAFHWRVWPFRDEGTWALNYGTDRVRFITPVYVGDRVRMTARIEEVRERGAGRLLVRTSNRVEIDGRDDPAMVADWLCLYLPASSAVAA